MKSRVPFFSSGIEVHPVVFIAVPPLEMKRGFMIQIRSIKGTFFSIDWWKMKKKTILSATLSASLLGLLLVEKEASALTGEDVMDRMNESERFGYIQGMIDMAAYQARLDGNEDLAQCIAAWFNDSPDGPQTVWANLDAYREHAAEAVVTLLIERECAEG